MISRKANAKSPIATAIFQMVPRSNRAPVTASTITDLKRAGVTAHAFPSWLILELRGPFADGSEALTAAATVLRDAAPIVALEAPGADGYLKQIRGAACTALTRLGSTCN